MSTRTAFRVAVGTPTGRRSTVWKFWVHGREAYILTRMFGSDAKVSLHSSGECQWSGTDSWVKKDGRRANSARHITKWTAEWPEGSTALHIFRVRIPETELRQIGAGEDLTSVQWLGIPPTGKTVSLECYVTPASDSDPAVSSALPHPSLCSLPLADGRWFVVLHHVADLDGRDLESLRNQLWEQAAASGVDPDREHRAVAFTINDGAARGFIELCPPAV